ncbi:MAG: hypothetical protein AAF990_08900 [Bacteroidota bacterium]
MKTKTELRASSTGKAMKTLWLNFESYGLGKSEMSKVKGGNGDEAAAAEEFIHEDEIDT